MPGCMIMKQVSIKSLTILIQRQNILILRKLVLARHEIGNQQVSTIFFLKKKSPIKALFVIRHYSTQLQYITWCWFYLTDSADTYG